MTGDPLPAGTLLDLWEHGAGATPAAQARLLLAAARPDWPADRLDEVGVGQRDAWLLDLRSRAFGDEIRATVACPACGSALVITMPSAQVCFEPPAPEPSGSRAVTVHVGGFDVLARTPDGADLAAAAAYVDLPLVRAALVDRCVLDVRRDGEPVPVTDLPDEVVAAVGDAVAEQDPQAEVMLDLVCAICHQPWTALLDVPQFLWEELSVAGKQLLDDVAVLAREFGWTEQHVLALSAWRRRTYVGRALDG